MEELPRGEARDEPTAAEAEFGEQLEALLTPKLGCYFWTDQVGAPWMVAYLTCATGPHPEISGPDPEGQYRTVKTWRLDFDSAGIRGGLSIDHMDWDGDLRAEVAGVDTGPPDGISVMAEGRTCAELAREAADWFGRRWADWERERDSPCPEPGSRTRRRPRRRR